MLANMAKENQYKSISKKNEGHIADLKKTNKQKKTWHRIKEIEVNGTSITEPEIICESFN